MKQLKKFESGSRTYERAQQAWPILTSIMCHKLDLCGFGPGIITYGKLGNLMGIKDQTAGRQSVRPVRHIYRFCAANGLPLLNAMVVNSKSEVPGWEEMFRTEEELREEQEKVIEEQWLNYSVPSAGTFKGYPLTGNLED